MRWSRRSSRFFGREFAPGTCSQQPSRCSGSIDLSDGFVFNCYRPGELLCCNFLIFGKNNNMRILTILMGFAGAVLMASPVSAQVLYGSQGGAQGGSGGSLVTLDTADASATLIDVPFGGAGMPGIEFLLDGRLFAVSSVNHGQELDTAYLLEINPTTGALINSQPLLDDVGNGCAFADLAVHPTTGVLYALAANQSSLGDRCGDAGGSTGGLLGTIDTATGIYTIIGRDAQFANQAGGIAFAPDGTLYFTTAWSSDDMLHTLDPATADVLSSTALTAGGNSFGLSWHPTENRLYGTFNLTSDQALVTIEPDTGAVTEVGSTDLRYLGIAFERGPAGPAAPAVSIPIGFAGWWLVLALLMTIVGLRFLPRNRTVA